MDVFKYDYEVHFIERLLYGGSVSNEAERGLLAKIKAEGGYWF